MLTPPPRGFNETHQDFLLIKQLEAAILLYAGGFERFRVDIPSLFRRAIDEVIDSARSNRFVLLEIEKTEKTYIGTKIEILLRNHLGMRKGRVLDLSIDGIEVDIKNTIALNWTIPSEALGHPCILLQARETSSQCSFGLIVIRENILNESRNRDGKRSISKVGLAQVYWLLRDVQYPQNVWEYMDPQTRAAINTPRGGAERLAALFRAMQGKPISRRLVQSVAQQDDYMKRIRRNGGARDLLAPEGIAVLWGQNDRDLIQKLGLPSCTSEEVISFKPLQPNDIALLRAAKHID